MGFTNKKESTRAHSSVFRKKEVCSLLKKLPFESPKQQLNPICWHRMSSVQLLKCLLQAAKKSDLAEICRKFPDLKSKLSEALNSAGGPSPVKKRSPSTGRKPKKMLRKKKFLKEKRKKKPIKRQNSVNEGGLALQMTENEETEFEAGEEVIWEKDNGHAVQVRITSITMTPGMPAVYHVFLDYLQKTFVVTEDKLSKIEEYEEE